MTELTDLWRYDSCQNSNLLRGKWEVYSPTSCGCVDPQLGLNFATGWNQVENLHQNFDSEFKYQILTQRIATQVHIQIRYLDLNARSFTTMYSHPEFSFEYWIKRVALSLLDLNIQVHLEIKLRFSFRLGSELHCFGIPIMKDKRFIPSELDPSTSVKLGAMCYHTGANRPGLRSGPLTHQSSGSIFLHGAWGLVSFECLTALAWLRRILAYLKGAGPQSSSAFPLWDVWYFVWDENITRLHRRLIWPCIESGID